MQPIADLISAARDSGSELCGLHLALGATPERPPPSEECIAAVRAQVSVHLGLTTAEGEQHPQHATWRYRIMEAAQRQAQDRDSAIIEWVKKGAPNWAKRPRSKPGAGLTRSSTPRQH